MIDDPSIACLILISDVLIISACGSMTTSAFLSFSVMRIAFQYAPMPILVNYYCSGFIRDNESLQSRVHLKLGYGEIMRKTLFLMPLVLCGCVTTQESEPPAIVDVIFHWDTHDRRAPGSDNWPITWSDDGHQYTFWGDGGGFEGTNKLGRVSLGFARVEGDRDNYQGINIWGGVDSEHPATFGGKSYGIISIDGVLYAWRGGGVAEKMYTNTRLLVSSNKGATWTKSSCDMTTVDDQLIMPTILNFGKDYAGARDSFVYHYFIRKEPTGPGLGIHKGGSPATGKIDLARVPANAMMDLFAYEFFTGLDRRGNPTWSADASQRVAVLEDSNGVGWTVSVSYNAGIRRYILMTEHTAPRSSGRMGMFDALEPWGPWNTVLYYDSPGFGAGAVEENSFYWNFSNKWLSADGRDFVLVFTGKYANDSWNTVHGTFVLEDTTPPTVDSVSTPDGPADVTASFSEAVEETSSIAPSSNVGNPAMEFR